MIIIPVFLFVDLTNATKCSYKLQQHTYIHTYIHTHTVLHSKDANVVLESAVPNANT
jgi:hypothetical protein